MKISLLMTAICCAFPWSIAGAAEADSAREVGDLGQVGDVSFETSCDPELQPEFDRGMALLHSFFYLEARNVFTAVAKQDPECAMAHWGIAMSYYHPLWTAPSPEELAEGRAAVERAVAAGKQNEREKAYVAALVAYYQGSEDAAEPATGGMSCHALGFKDDRGRAACFQEEMGKIATRYPEDLEASAFYALSLIGTAPPGDQNLRQQRQAAAILEKWYATHPDHPGLAHYLIHSYDYPPLAEKGLPTARAYAAIAPWVPHALHMPSHIFTRLGMWQENIDSNIASAEAARRYAAQHHPDAASFEELHALDYMIYGYLQTAQVAKAKEVLDRVRSITKTYPEVDFAVAYAFGAIPARYTLERRQWKEAMRLEVPPMPFWKAMPFSEGHIAYAHAVGAARSGDLAAAKAAAKRLAELSLASSEPRMRYFATQMDMQREAALALVAFATGDRKKAIATLRAVAAREDSLGKHPVSPGALFPVRELLGEALLDFGKPDESLAEFEASLRIHPGRFNGIYGAARAAAAAGRLPDARRYYTELVELTAKSDTRRPEIAEAQKFLAQ